MVAYVSMFFVTTLLIAIAERRKKQIVLVIFAILCASVFAGIRDLSVGTDIYYYIYWDFIKAKNHLGDFWAFFTDDNNGLELLYMVVQYFCAIFFKSCHSTMFFLALFTYTTVYLGICEVDYQYNCSRWFPWLIYCLLFYNTSLNLMRQSLAMAIVFYAIVKISSTHPIKSLIYILLAMLFHTSAIIGAILWGLYWVMDSSKQYRILILLGAIMFPFCVQLLLRTAIDIGILSQKYELYFAKDAERSVFGQNIVLYGMVLAVFLCYIFCKIRHFTADECLMGLLVIWSFVFPFVYNLLIGRVALYISLFSIKALAVGTMSISKAKGGHSIVRGMILAALFVYWCIQGLYFNAGETYPYLIETNW